MKPPLSPAEVAAVRALRGHESAAAVGALFSRGAETIRRIWRGEVYGALAEAAPPTGHEAEEVDASLARLAASLLPDEESETSK